MPVVVILLSDKRSGSTLFQEELCSHAAIETVPYSPHSNLETHWWLMAAVLLRRPGTLFASGRPYKGYGSAANTRAYMRDLLEKCVPDFEIPENDRDLVFDGWEALCTAYARPVFFEKSPQLLAQWVSLSLILEWMERTSFEVKIVSLVRNPHSVMYSAAKLFGTDPETRQLAWLNGCRNLLAFSQMIPPESQMHMRYEELVNDPVNQFSEVARFVGVEPDPMVGVNAHSGSTQKWVSDPEYLLSLDPAVMQIAGHFGYSREDLENPNRAPADADKCAVSSVNRRSIRLLINRLRDRFVQPMLIRLRFAFHRKG